MSMTLLQAVVIIADAPLVFRFHVEQFVYVEKVFEGVGAIEDLMVPPKSGQHGPEHVRV